jgi:hypothetical protein
LAKRVSFARDEIIALGADLLPERKLRPTLAILRELLQYTPYAALIGRRKEPSSQGDRGRPRQKTARG